jgi:hypothetical protein
MGKHEKIIVPDKPPAPRAPAVIAHLQSCKRELAALQREIPGHLLAVAEERPGAKEDLAALREKIAAAEFEIQHHAGARLMAERLDEEAMVAWKADVQALPADQIVEGITREACCRRCIPGNCVITGSDQLSGPCAHPVLVGALELTRYKNNPKIQTVFAAACAKLGLMRLHA